MSVKWAKYNIGVNPNKLTKASDWYGNYYAWGETEPKNDYSWKTYKYANDSEETITKYCNNSKYGYDGYKDELTQLVPEDDAATATNSAWRMPTKTELEELMTLSSQWITNYDPSKTEHNPEDDGGIKGLNGRVFTGNNGNTLFIPTAGYRNGSDIGDAGSYCYSWSSSLSLDEPYRAYSLCFYSGNIFMTGYDRRYGFSVRPVCK